MNERGNRQSRRGTVLLSLGAGLSAGLAVLMLAGCADPVTAVGAVGAAVTMESMTATKKLPTDHALSWATGRDCSIIHFEKEGEYCPPNPHPVDRSNMYCIKTLGDVECRELPDPFRNGDRALASPPPPPVAP